MSTSKTNQTGEPAAKHVAFTPAHSEAGDTASATSQPTGSSDRSQPTQGSASRQPEGKSTQHNDNPQGGLEAQAKSWLNQQQWLQNIDVNQLSKQAKDLGSKAVEQVNRLTPTQKVVGGALLVSGLSWLALRSAGSSNKGQAYYGNDSQTGKGDHEDDTWQRSSESVYRGHKKEDA
ncbi:hypothetical protein [Hymenobacter psychrophilus]|uniref:DUF3618 domain-containing protein n=1 Tax=Hymenobacter psychrophilus TaxID=651662 RepID=A0A1H3JSM9_9BACT|nr:hypothetical protein [Hymenobacter psychrophilus]SDY42980.1 hypothetical protein SAMN04488069_108203 [Hymenobacter psychrophilus]